MVDLLYLVTTSDLVFDLLYLVTTESLVVDLLYLVTAESLVVDLLVDKVCAPLPAGDYLAQGLRPHTITQLTQVLMDQFN